jgi:proteasome lid subunit RPN8/RPN11
MTEKPESDALEEYKKKLKQELKKQLLEEIYQELKSEEKISKEVLSKMDMDKVAEEKKHEDVQVGVAEVTVEKLNEKANLYMATKVVLKVASHALKYANKKIPREDWVEVIGLLAGTYDEQGDVLYIEDAYPMGHGNAVYAEIKDYKNYIKAYTDLRKDNLFICGWYHSHPSYGLFMSDEDIGTQSRYQRLWKRAVALVIDPYMIDGKDFGFKIFRANLKTHKWHEIPYEFKEPIKPEVMPELMKFINPIIDGKALYLEYDED